MLVSPLKAKPDLNTTLPVRQTASIFKQPVTKVTNHPNNKVKADPQKAVDQPKQVSQRAGNMHISVLLNYFLEFSGNDNITIEKKVSHRKFLLLQVVFCTADQHKACCLSVLSLSLFAVM